MNQGLEEFKNDPQIQSFIELELQKQRFQVLVADLNSQCWDLCVEKPSSRLEPKTENCLVNCVGRFIDTTNFVVNRLEKSPGLSGGGSGSDGEFISS